ncbi:MAG: hypothetical protein ACK5TQ_08690, partial [Acetobacteraceae bacterium]
IHNPQNHQDYIIFKADELAGILAAAGDAVSDGDAPEALPADTAENPAAPAIGEETDDPADAEPEAPRQAVSRSGDLWLLGTHRLLCGDSTDAAAVTIANDALGKGFLDFLRPALTNLLSVTKGASYVCMSSSEWPTLHRAWQEAGGKWSSTIIWAKNTFALGLAD